MIIKNLCRVSILLLLIGNSAIADHGGYSHGNHGLVVPATNGTGDYTVTWTTSNSGLELEESLNGSAYATVYAGTATSKSFTGKADGIYTYRTKVNFCLIACLLAYSAPQSIVVINLNSGISAAPSEGTINSVGITGYGIDVDTDGDAILSVPVSVIPGVANFAPAVSLEYDSGRGVSRLEQSLPEDTLGYGWRLAANSNIRRCVVDQTSSNSINLTTSDSLCMDGMPLVLASGTHFTVGAIYRTQIESYTKIELKGSSGALWFEATLSDGTVQEYGNGGGSRVDKNGGTDYQWSMNKASSSDGNDIYYWYHHDSANGINYIRHITYSDAEVEFKYVARTDAAAVSIGSVAQMQSAFLHTILVKFENKKVREYRMLDEVVDNRRRLNKVQHCGYDEAGTTISCLSPLDFDWRTPSSTMAGVDILIDGLTDGLNAIHQIDYGTITGSSHTFLYLERPFGNGVLPTNTQLLSGSGAYRHVVTMLRRDNGIGGFHDTTYAYQDQGLESTRHWGFLGFYSQRIKDEQSGIVTYIQYRMDYPYFGEVSRLHQYDSEYPSHTQTLTRSENDFAQQTISHSVGSTVYPYVGTEIDVHHEGSTQIGATHLSNTLTFVGGFATQVESTTQVGTGFSVGTSSGVWGDIPTYTMSGVLNTSETEATFTNRTTSGQWLVGFPNSVTTESWPGLSSGSGIVRDATLVPHASSLRPTQVTQYPNDSYLTLVTDIAYDSSGRTESMTISGDSVSSRVTSISSFIHDRYPAQVKNAKNQTTTYSAYDSRFGLVKTTGDPNNKSTSRGRDPFGRINSFTNGDGVVTTATYTDCPAGCGILVYGIAPSYYVRTDSLVTPITNTYFDSLGRVIRTEVESFTGLAYSKTDTKYDDQGRVDKTSLPYFSGLSHDLDSTYDIRNRITDFVRPDGSNTSTGFSVVGSTVLVTITDNVKNADGTSAGIQVKRNEYNILGQLTKTTDGFGTTTDPSTSFTYDADGNVLTAVVNGGVDGTTTTTMEYDAAGNQEKLIGPNIGTITTTYTALGEIKTNTDNKGQLFTHAYDLLGRLTSIVSADGTSTWLWDIAQNGIGSLYSRSNTGFSEIYTYDSDARLDTVTTNITPIGGSVSVAHTTIHTYDTHGRRLTTTYPGGFVMTRAYNARGYLSQLKNGVTAVHTFNDQDAFGNTIDENFGNGVGTLRTFDPETGRPTDIDTTVGSTIFQNNEYEWRSNGTLQSRIANPAFGLNTTRKETFTYDVLNRMTLAETYINSSNTRDLTYTYDELGNLESGTSTIASDIDVTGYVHGAGAAGPHAVTSAVVEGVTSTLTYDLNGAVTKYDIAGTSDDKYIAYNSYNQPTKILVGSSLNDTTPVAEDEFAYDPNGQRYARRSSWQNGGSTVTEEVSYIGPVEIISDDEIVNLQTITKTRLGSNVMHVKMTGSVTETFFEYAHRDHLGSIEVVTDENGNKLENLAFEPFGARKSKDWTTNISSTELNVVLDLDWDHPRMVRGFTGHEHLDRTGLIHMNGRVFDPVLGRFLSPDPYVQFPDYSQNWNRYSYVNNTPTAFTDPSGYVEEPLPEIITTGKNNKKNRPRGGGSGWGMSVRIRGAFSIGGGGASSNDNSDEGGTNACDFDTVACESFVTGTLEDSQVTFVARLINVDIGTNQVVSNANGIAAAGVIGAGQGFATATVLRKLAFSTATSYLAIAVDLGWIEVPGGGGINPILLGGVEIISGVSTLIALSLASAGSSIAVVVGIAFGGGYAIGRGIVNLTGDSVTNVFAAGFCALDTSCK